MEAEQHKKYDTLYQGNIGPDYICKAAESAISVSIEHLVLPAWLSSDTEDSDKDMQDENEEGGIDMAIEALKNTV
jgi:hypothetical protein